MFSGQNSIKNIIEKIQKSRRGMEELKWSQFLDPQLNKSILVPQRQTKKYYIPCSILQNQNEYILFKLL